MISVLDMLRSRLGGGGSYAPAEGEMSLDELNRMIGAPSSRAAELPTWLPETVRNSILFGQSYGEGRTIPGPDNPLMEQELSAFAGPQRDQQLPFNRAEALGLLNPYSDPWGDLSARAVPEGGMWSSRAPGQSPFASPLNQFLQLGRRAPLALY